MSLDDFYLTKNQRRQLAREQHPLLVTRGVPGTHDASWLQRSLEAMHAGQSRHQGDIRETTLAQLSLPSFDKGRDDRAGQHEVQAQVLVLEGWCVGVSGQSDSALRVAANRLEEDEDPHGHWRGWVNEQIDAHYLPCWQHVDYWLQLQAPSFDQVLQWRAEQELSIPEPLRMGKAALERFIQHYERLTRWQWQCTPLSPGIQVLLDEQHQISGLRGA